VLELLEPLRRHRALLLAPLLGVLLSYAYFVAAPAWNQNSRLALTRALVERHTTIIDDHHETTGDKSFRDGHFYSDKAPGTSLLATIPYAALHAFRVLTRGELPGVGVHPLDPKAVAAGEHPRPEDRLPGDVLVYNQTHRLALWLCGLFAVALPSLLGAMAVFLLALRELGDRPRPALLVALTYAIATPAFPYSTVLYGHQPCAALLVAAFAVIALLPAGAKEDASDRGGGGTRDGLADAGGGPARPSIKTEVRNAAILCGALLGLAVVTEYTAAVVVVILCAWALRRHGSRFAVHVIAGGLPFAVLLAAYHTAAFGGPLRTGYDFVWREEFAEGMREQYGLGLPDPHAALALTFGSYRGLFYLSPILLLAVWGLGAQLVDKDPERRTRAAIAAVIVAYYWLLNSGYYMWDGGASAGPRHMVPALPFLALGLASAITTVPRIFAALAIVSAMHMLLLAAAAPEATQFGDPIWEYALPKVVSRTPGPAVTSTNVGLLLGLPSVLSLAPLVAVWIWLFPRRGKGGGPDGLRPAGEAGAALHPD
jgi:hypothetical protein